jgi:hypothetical protein
MLIWKHMLFSVDCLAGTELQADGSCKKCKRGYYRSQAEDNCLSWRVDHWLTKPTYITVSRCFSS